MDKKRTKKERKAARRKKKAMKEAQHKPQQQQQREEGSPREGQRSKAKVSYVVPDVEEFVSAFPQLLQESHHHLRDDKLFMAHRAIRKIQQSLQHHHALASTYAEALQKKLQEIDAELESNREHIESISKEKREVRKLMRELLNQEGWTLVGEHEDGNVKVFYRNEESTPVHSIKLQGVVDASALNLMAVMNEHDLYRTWIPLLKEVRRVKQISRYRKVMYLTAHLPWPISSRDALLYGYGVDNLEDNRAVIMIRSAGEGDLEPHLIPPIKSHVRVDVHYTGVMIEPIDENRTRLTMMTNCDPKLAYLPYTLLNWATKVLAYQMWSMMATHAKGIEGSEYEELIAQNEAFYAEIKAKLNSYFANAESSSTLSTGTELTDSEDESSEG